MRTFQNGHSALVAGPSSLPISRASTSEQIAAILGPDIFRWAGSLLPDDVGIDDVRHRDLIDVSEDEVMSYVTTNGFNTLVVAEDAVDDDRICIVQKADGWHVFYTERGSVSEEAMFAERDDARREVVRRLMKLARIMLNHRYWHAHGLAFPCSED